MSYRYFANSNANNITVLIFLNQGNYEYQTGEASWGSGSFLCRFYGTTTANTLEPDRKDRVYALARPSSHDYLAIYGIIRCCLIFGWLTKPRPPSGFHSARDILTSLSGRPRNGTGTGNP